MEACLHVTHRPVGLLGSFVAALLRLHNRLPLRDCFPTTATWVHIKSMQNMLKVTLRQSMPFSGTAAALTLCLC